MLTFSGSLKIFVAVEPCDMRKGFNGLHAMASECHRANENQPLVGDSKPATLR